eukprot:Blabericola_migrator_1__4477@NODE_2392_length_2834_cov_382_153596_g1497_i0_p3_GENE_NODE_2392_length_2834_cov_382_153596_g1497_i0NODE_2392_length_2834_cov_382_153596_g1497_i0_p3_ORF_typecomplete_len214_score15_26_NODE_2392_length_2834_cov_382_153596_g1497_i010871728
MISSKFLVLCGLVIAGQAQDGTAANCINRDRMTCILAANQVYVESEVCTGWCDESRQCLGPGGIVCPLGEMVYQDFAFVSSASYTPTQCTAIKEYGTKNTSVKNPVRGWCQPNSANGDFNLGHCSEAPMVCDTTISTLLLTVADIPCSARTNCFDCVAKGVTTSLDCNWCGSTCQDTTCTDGVTASSGCPNINRYREARLQAKAAENSSDGEL